MNRHHGAELRRLTDDPVLSERIIQDYRRAGLDEKTRNMLDYAIKSTRTPVDCDEADIEKLQNPGFGFDDYYIVIESMHQLVRLYQGMEGGNMTTGERSSGTLVSADAPCKL